MTDTMSLFCALLTVVANSAVLGALVLVGGARWSPALAGMLQRVRAQLAHNGTWTAWIVAVVAMRRIVRRSNRLHALLVDRGRRRHGTYRNRSRLCPGRPASRAFRPPAGTRRLVQASSRLPAVGPDCLSITHFPRSERQPTPFC